MPHSTPTGPRRQLVLVTLLAAISIAALLVSRPRPSGAVWERGDDLALVAAWVVALIASAWLFVGTGACVVALQFRRPRLARRLAPALPLGVRRLVEIVIVSSCIALPALPAHAAVSPHASVVADDQPVVRAPDTTAPVARTNPPPPPTPSPPPAAAPARVVVRAGDSLWLIARDALTHASARAPDDAEVARYWRAVVAANRSTLRSGDPSLIFPGEIVTLPVGSAVS